MNKDKFQILRDFAISNDKPDKTIYKYIKEVLDMNSAYAKENQSLKKENKILRENAEHNDKVVDKVNWENNLLQQENKQLKEELKRYKQIYRENPTLYDEIAPYIIRECELENKLDSYKSVIDEIRKKCNLEINASSIQYEREHKQIHLSHKVEHERILEIIDKIKELEEGVKE